jgi:triphosphoribosyl-dephospho-CoA synthase
MTNILALATQWTHLSKAQMPPPPDLETVAASAVRSLLLELETWPKPGLVSHVDTGSHDDMDAETFRASAAAIGPYFHALADAGAQGCGMGRLRIIGLDAEAAMLAVTAGINTHRGAIFGLGLLCAAVGARAAGRTDPAWSLGTIVSQLWGNDILDGPVLLRSHGDSARRRFGAGGARMEAFRGFPSVYEIGLPALQAAARAAPDDAEAQRVQTCFALIAALEDTNLLHRGGPRGLRFARRTAGEFIESGGVATAGWRERARSAHDRFVSHRLSPGGSADLLAMTLFVKANERDRS